MNRIIVLLGIVVAFALTTQDAIAGGPPKSGKPEGNKPSSDTSGFKPWDNIFAKRNPYMSVEEERLQLYWHDYYDSLRKTYDKLDRIDWVEYYKSRGHLVRDAKAGCAGCGAPSIPVGPVFVGPRKQSAAPGVPPVGKVPVLGDLPKSGSEFAPGQQTRSADDFELFLEGILEAPRGPRNAFAKSPTTSTNGCIDGKCANSAGMKKVEINQTPTPRKEK
jgi:hypothetical protein